MGRRLESATSSGGTKISYTYNADGLLTSKKKGSIEYYYYWNGDKLTAQTDGVNTWYFRYDGDTPIGLEFDGIEYYYVTNLQGDVIAILNDSGECVAEYSYDAWGNCTVTKDTDTIAYDNPLRYRGYYYDFDTGFYYLQSRYYDANTGRFINADEPSLIGANGGMVSNNLFAYCDNNPVNKADPSGKWLIQLICGIAGAAVFGTVANIICRLLGTSKTVRRLITAGFALIGGILGAAFGPSLVGKIAPKLLSWVKKFEKIINSKSRFRPMLFEGHTAIGWEWNKRFKIMLHFKHRGEPEKGMHITIQHFTGRNWRRTIPDIPIKSLGKSFIKWVKKYLK